MAKQGSTRDRPNPRHCQSFELVSLTGRRSLGFHQGQRSVYRSGKGRIHDCKLYRRFKSVFPLQHRGRPYMTMPFSGFGFLRRGRRGRARGLKLEPPSLQLRWRDAELGSHTAMRRTRLRQPGNRLFLVFSRKSPPRLLCHLVPPGRYSIYRLVRDPGATSPQYCSYFASRFHIDYLH